MIIIPELNVNRTDDHIVLIDADCVAYYGAAGCDEMPLASAHRRIDLRIDQILDDCKSNQYECYLTGSTNFRNSIATLARYKGNRYNEDGKRVKTQPSWLQECRRYLESSYGARMSSNCEADDDLSIRCAELQRAGKRVIISSLDKDLRINPCKHHNQMNGEMTETIGDGEVHMQKNSCKGHGLMFFYAQMLMGDKADCIPGLPKVTQYMKDTFGIQRLGGCGDKSAYTIISQAKDAEEAERFVLECYASYWSEHSYTDWRETAQYVGGYSTYRKQFIEQGRLLWMQTKVAELWNPIVREPKHIYNEVQEAMHDRD